MNQTGNRIRQARRQADLSQQSLATMVGVHRSAVAQWERRGGCHPTVENCARIALATVVSFEWLVTGRGRMIYLSDIIPGDETPAVLLNHSAQSETEVRALAAMRKLSSFALLPIVEMMEALAHPRPIKVNRQTAYCR